MWESLSFWNHWNMIRYCIWKWLWLFHGTYISNSKCPMVCMYVCMYLRIFPVFIPATVKQTSLRETDSSSKRKPRSWGRPVKAASVIHLLTCARWGPLDVLLLCRVAYVHSSCATLNSQWLWARWLHSWELGQQQSGVSCPPHLHTSFQSLNIPPHWHWIIFHRTGWIHTSYGILWQR